VNQIASDLEAGSSGWTYWNLILDQHGGPWLISPIHQDPDNNVQQPVVIIDRDIHKISYTGVYYAIAHFSKFVRPGSIRIGSDGSADGIRCVAFIRPDGRRVTELINSRGSNSSIQIVWQGKLLELSLPPISISTLLW
jgi:glucosylceramidase